MDQMYIVVSDEGKVGLCAGSAYAIFPTRAEALRYILENGLGAIARIEEF